MIGNIIRDYFQSTLSGYDKKIATGFFVFFFKACNNFKSTSLSVPLHYVSFGLSDISLYRRADYHDININLFILTQFYF